MAHLAGHSLTNTGEADAVRRELARIIDSPVFKDSDRLVRFLTFIVEETLQGRGPGLKEPVVGTAVFDRSADYDPKEDPIVRVQARRLRAKLELYYASPEHPGELRIELPKGGYTPQFSSAPRAGAVQVTLKQPLEAVERAPAGVPWNRALIILAVLLGASGAWMFVVNRRAPARPGGSRLFTAYPGYQHTPAFSPDGQTVAFSWGAGGNSAIYVQRLDSDTPRRLTSSAMREWRPVWLPDGQSVGFLRDDGRNRFAVMVVPLVGAGERRVATLSGDPSSPPRIQWSPEGRELYTSEPSSGAQPRIVEIDLESGKRRDLTRTGSTTPGRPGDDEAALSPDGHWIAFRRRTESAVGDVFVAQVHGNEVRQVTHDGTGIIGSAWSRDGRSLIISSRRSSSLQRLWRFPIDGRSAPVCLTDAALAASFPAVSPLDGTIAFATRYLDSNIWRIALRGGAAPERIIASNLLDSTPRYSPDLSRIAFRSNRTGNDELWIADANGGSPARVTNFGGPVTGSERWSPDGQYLIFDSRPHGNSDIFLVPAGGGTPRQLTREPSNEVIPSFSPDGKYVYFASDRKGAWQTWRQPLAGGEAEQVTRDGAFRAQESADGKWLYYSKVDTAGLYRMPSGGGSEVAVLPSFPAVFWGGWTLIGEKVLYFSMRAQDKPGDPTELKMFDPSSGKAWTVSTTPFPPVRWDGALDASPDGQYALVSLLEREGSEIHLLPEQ